eukprot:6899742-Pyramimonas_sp.AAC.1
MGMSFMMNILAYNLFAFPTLSYVAQLLPPSKAALRREYESVQLLHAGPFNAISHDMMLNL